MIQSAWAMTAWWCSITITDLPESTSRSSRREQLLDVGEVEAAGRLVEHEHVPFSAMWVASFSRCRSPPDSVVSGWPMREVAEPDVGEPFEDLVRGGRAASPSPKNVGASATGIARTSLMSLPPNVYSSTGGVEPLPAAHLAGGRDAGHHRRGRCR